MGVFLQIAARNLVLAKLRTFFLGLALSAVTVLLVLLLSLSQGLTDTMVEASTTLSSGHVNVAGWYKMRTTDAAPLVTNTSELRKIVEENTPYLDLVIDRARGWARIVSETSSLNAGIDGVDISEERRLVERIRLAPRSAYKDDGDDKIVGDLQRLGDEGTILIFAAQAKRLGVDVGDVLTVSAETGKGVHNTIEATVVAVAKDVGFLSNFSTFMSKATVRKLYRIDDDVSGAVQVYLTDYTKSTEVMGHLRTVLADKGYLLMEHDPQPFWMKFESVTGEDWTGQKVDLTIWSDEISFLLFVVTAVNGVSFLLIGILMVIIAVGIMNSMWISVRERTTEVGTLRAIGMSRPRVLLMFLLEALLLGFFATGIGGLIGAAIAVGIDAAQIEVPVDAVRSILMSDTINLSVHGLQVFVSVLVFTLIAGLAALWPALKASRMQPVTAIHHVG